MPKIMTNTLREELYEVVANTIDFGGNPMETGEQWMIENDIDYNQRTLENNVFQCVVRHAEECNKIKQKIKEETL